MLKYRNFPTITSNGIKINTVVAKSTSNIVGNLFKG